MYANPCKEKAKQNQIQTNKTKQKNQRITVKTCAHLHVTIFKP